MASVKEQVQKTLIPLMTQFTGQEPRAATRNICLIDSEWFDKFRNWISNGGANPGPITNEKLREKLNNNEDVSEKTDFELIERNVNEALTSIFSGGPTIMRPYMVHPISKVARVVICPQKFNVSIEGNLLSRTADPLWTVFDFIVTIAEKINFDPQQLRLRAGKNNLANDISMKDVYAQFGADLIIDLPLTAQVKTKPFYSPSTSLSCVTRSLSRPTDHSIGSSASLPARAFQSSIASMFYSFIFAFVQNTQIKEFALQYENHEFQDDSLLLSFIEYIQEVNRIPNTLVQPHQFSSLFFRLQPELGSVRYFDAAATVNGVINRLADEVPDGKPFKEIMSSRIIREEKCPKCGFSRPAEDLMPCFKLDIQSKVFRKATLMDCIAAFLQPKKIGHGKTDTCPKCHKKINLREQIKLVQLPNILMLALTRFIREGNSINKKSTEVNYTHELCMDKFTGHSGDNYELMSVVAHAGHTIQQKAKVFIRDQADKEKWSFYNDSRAIVADSKSVILPGAAVVLIYQKCA